jgi:hypothetical protein
MNKSACLINFTLALALCASTPAVLAAQNAAPQDTSAHLLVTAEARHGSNVPEISRADVMVREGHDRDQVTAWVPAQGDNAALELFILLDDGSDFSLGSQLEPIRQFITTQPPSTKIGIAYMQNGIGRVEQSPTADHALAAKALRLPMGIGAVNASPYISLSDLIKRWPESPARREVVMVSDGVDSYYGSGDLEDPYLSAAIDDADRAGIVVFAIYTPGAGHSGHSYWWTYWGQMYLARLTEETGGESFGIGFNGPPVSVAPYLEGVGRRLTHQYLLTFIPKPQKKSGWQKVKVTTEISNAELVSADRVYVPAAAP